jgi:hypothetical protein
MKTICFEETTEENVISFPTDDPLEAFNKIKSECLDTDVIIVKSKDSEILKPIDSYTEKLRNSECTVGGTLNTFFDTRFDLLESDTVFSRLSFINYRFCIINCTLFKDLEAPEFDIGETELDVYQLLSVLVSPLVEKSYVFPKLYLDPYELPCTLSPEECFATEFKPLSETNTIFYSDILLNLKYTESELEEKWHIEPRDLRLLELKQQIIERAVVQQEWDIQRV